MNSILLRQRAATLILTSLIAALAGAAAAAPSGIAPLHRAALHREARVEVFIQLDTPSVAELNATSMRATGEFASHEAQQQQAARIDAQQREFRPYLSALGATELGALRVGANGLRVRIDRQQLESLKNLPGVRSIGRVQHQRVHNITSVPWIGAPVVWNTLKAKGQHIKIGIIDTGIDYTHANFGGPGTPAAYAAIDPNVVTPGTFPTAKVKGGIDFAGADYNADDPDSVPVPDANPLDVVGHGSHVAGTAAGLGVPGKIGPGVAPAADLYAIKIFGDVEGTTNLTSQGIEWCLDPNGDGDMRDHLDVINLSLGSDFSDPNDPSAIEAQHAADLGIVVVSSAGNSAAVPYVTGAPANAPGAISVAASIPGGRVWARVNVSGPAAVSGFKDNLEGAGPVQLVDLGTIEAAIVNSSPVQGCTAYDNAGAVAGRIALVERGTCSFVDKYNFAAAAGAVAIIVYNDGADPTRVDPLVMAADGTTIPGVMISSTDGVPLAAAAAAGPVSVTLDTAPNPAKDDQIASFSSRGPGSGGTHFKPEISAPGYSIVSTGVGTGTEGANLQGTSMAAPHIAGSAALLRQLHPRFAPDAIKALLLNSTVNANPSGDTDLARQGVGVVRVDRAAALTSYASPAGVSFGRLNPLTRVSRTQAVTLTDFGGHPRFFSVKNIPQHTYPGVKVSCPSFVPVGRNSSNRFFMRLTFNPRAAQRNGVSDDWFASETEVDGWCVLSDGKDTLRIGYLASVDAASLVYSRRVSDGTLAVANIGPATGLVEGFTLVGDGNKPAASDDDQSDATPTNSIAQVGARSATVGGQATVQVGIALSHIWQHISALQFIMLLDLDNDGTPDVELDAVDQSLLDPTLPPGTFVTAQFSGDEGFFDWPVIWDFNDRVATLTFTSADNTGEFGAGFVPRQFSYHLILVNVDGSTDTLDGAVDLSQEVAPDLNDFSLEPGESAKIGFSRSGKTLWLYPGNVPHSQVDQATINVRTH